MSRRGKTITVHLTRQDWHRVYELFCQSRKGVRLHPDDSNFLNKVLAAFPEHYGIVHRVAWSHTTPYGAKVEHLELPEPPPEVLQPMDIKV